MSWLYMITSGIVLFIFIYLLVALFYPEKF
jgi:K+-transporting ATPase KdpF subunit